MMSSLVCVLISTIIYFISTEVSCYRIIQLSDFLNSDIGYYGNELGIDGSNPMIEDSLSQILKLIKKDDPDFVIVAGDFIGGRWWGGTPKAQASSVQPFGSIEATMDNYERYAREAAAVYYPAWFQRFIDADLPVYTIPGDHEYGDAPEIWHKNNFRKTMLAKLQIELYGKYSSQYMPKNNIQRPVGTPFENTSYSFTHKGTLFVMLDLFDYDYATTKQSKEFGKFFTTCRGKYLEWVENQLKAAYNDKDITRIIVVGHTPIISFDYAYYSSKLVYKDSLDQNGAKSQLWSLFAKYNVDVYMAGEIHAINVHVCKAVVQTTLNGYVKLADRVTYAVYDIEDDRIDIKVKYIQQKTVPVDPIWTPSEGFLSEFRLIDADRSQVYKKHSGSIIGTGDDRVFENIKCSWGCADEDKDATCVENPFKKDPFNKSR